MRTTVVCTAMARTQLAFAHNFLVFKLKQRQKSVKNNKTNTDSDLY